MLLILCVRNSQNEIRGKKGIIMTQDPLTLYKLIVLFMLDRVNFPLTKAQISDFILQQEYTNFLTLQRVLSDLSDANFVITKVMGNRTLLSITEEGKDTLSYFDNRINIKIKEDIELYLQNNRLELRNEVSIQSNYYKSTSGDYEARLIGKDKETILVDITMSVPTEEIAISICANWNEKNQQIYKYLTEQLF